MAISSDGWRFKAITNVHYDQYNANLLYGLMGFLRHASLEAGAFQNISYSNASGILGGDFSRMRLVADPNYTDGQVWEAFRGDWIWETGTALSPSINSGVFVNDVWSNTSTDTGDNAHYVDFPRGRAVFTTAISTSSVVKASFAHRVPSIVKASDNWLRELMFDSVHVERSDFLSSSSGMWDQPYDVRRQLPIVGISLVNRRGFEPYELGSAQWVHQAVDIYVVSQDNNFVNQWIDILTMQNDRTVWLPNRKLMQEDATYPQDLDFRGVPVSGAKPYPQLIQPTGEGGFGWTNAIWEDTTAEKIDGLPDGMYAAAIHATFTVVLPSI